MVLLADAVAALHAAFLVFVVVGGVLAWRWRWLVVPHAAEVAWAVAVVVADLGCPLTPLEKRLRQAGGQQAYPGPFIDWYLAGRLYPADAEEAVRAGLAVVVVLSWAVLWARWPRRLRIPGPAAGAPRPGGSGP